MRRFRPLLPVLVITAIILTISLVLGLRQPPQDPVRDHSMHRANPWGTKALAELCRRHGLEVRAWSRKLSLLTPRQRVLCVFDPSRMPLPWELTHLLDWVKAGGVLVVGAHLEEEHNLLSSTRGPGPDARVLAALGLTGDKRGPQTAVALPIATAPELREVQRVTVPGPHRLRPLTRDELAQRNRQLQEADPKATPLTILATPAWRPLLADAAGKVLLTASWGRGRLYALAEVEAFSNANLAREDNVVLAANLLYGAGARRVHFAEGLHWVRSGLSEEAEELDPSRVRAALWLAMAAVALFFLGRARRFGAATPLPEVSRRSVLEFVDALADLYRRAEARGAVVGLLRDTFRHRLATAVGLSPETPGPALAAAVAHHRDLKEAELAALLAEVDAAVTSPLTEPELLHLAQRLAQVEEAVIHGR